MHSTEFSSLVTLNNYRDIYLERGQKAALKLTELSDLRVRLVASFILEEKENSSIDFAKQEQLVLKLDKKISLFTSICEDQQKRYLDVVRQIEKTEKTITAQVAFAFRKRLYERVMKWEVSTD